MKALLDTSVLVPALIAGHPRHVPARSYFDRMLAGEVAVAVATHVLAETFATLTALPVSPQVTPLEAERLIRERIVANVEVVALGAADYDAVIKRVAGLVSGTVYDALHVHAAEKAGCAEFVTFNGRDFRRFPLQPPTRLVVL